MKPTFATFIVFSLLFAGTAVSAQSPPAVKAQVLGSQPVVKKQGDKKPDKKTADKNSENKKSEAGDAKKPAKKATPKVSPERAKELLDFVGKHHPELKGMLTQLEEKQPRSFRQAMNGIDRSVKKIDAVKSRSPQRYEGALEQWKLNSRINVAKAQLTLDDKPENRKKLEDLFSKSIDLQVARSKQDRDQLLKRIDQIDKRISSIEAGRSEEIQKRVKAAMAKKKKPPQPKKD